MASVFPPTRAQIRQDVLNIADANGTGGQGPASPRWDATPGGEVDRRIGFCHRREWKRILQAQPYFNINFLTPTTDANGNIPFSSLITGAGDALQTYYRVLGVYVNNFKYEYVDARNWLQTTVINVQDFVWFYNGNSITIPQAPNVTLTGLWVNWVPQRFDQLATDQSIVSLPTDYDEILSYEAAATLLTKGAAQMEAAAALLARAELMRQEFLADIDRISIDPMTVQYGDSPLDWGNQGWCPITALCLHIGVANPTSTTSWLCVIAVLMGLLFRTDPNLLPKPLSRVIVWLHSSWSRLWARCGKVLSKIVQRNPQQTAGPGLAA